MRQIDVNQNSPLFVPNYVADSVTDIDFKLIRSSGIEYVAFDADGTLVGYRKKILDDEIKSYLQNELSKFKGVCIASNRVTDDLNEIAKGINADVVRATLTTRKPSVKFFDRVVELFQAKPDKIIMIGDKLIADIYGGNKAGMETIWVNKRGKDSMFDRILQTRRFEKILTRSHLKDK